MGLGWAGVVIVSSRPRFNAADVGTIWPRRPQNQKPNGSRRGASSCGRASSAASVKRKTAPDGREAAAGAVRQIADGQATPAESLGSGFSLARRGSNLHSSVDRIATQGCKYPRTLGPLNSGRFYFHPISERRADGVHV